MPVEDATWTGRRRSFIELSCHFVDPLIPILDHDRDDDAGDDDAGR
jgi:hypothetical protein